MKSRAGSLGAPEGEGTERGRREGVGPAREGAGRPNKTGRTKPHNKTPASARGSQAWRRASSAEPLLGQLPRRRPTSGGGGGGHGTLDLLLPCCWEWVGGFLGRGWWRKEKSCRHGSRRYLSLSAVWLRHAFWLSGLPFLLCDPWELSAKVSKSHPSCGHLPGLG